MRPMRWLVAGMALLLAGVIAAAWVLPARLDTERFRAPLQRLASHTLGAPVRIAGPIRLILLPRPMLEAGGLAIAASGGVTAPTLTAQGVRLRLALGPLLVGRIATRSLLLYRPDLRLPGRFDPRLLLVRRPAWLGDAATRIEDGRIEAAGVVIDGIDARVAADPLTLDLAAAGTAVLPGAAWAFSVRLTQPGGDGAAGLTLSLTGRDTSLGFSGQLGADGALQGHGAAHGPDLALLLPAPSLPFSAEGRVSVADGLAEADDLTVRLGGAPARGAVAWRLAPAPRLDLALAASRLDLAPWLALLRHGEREGGGWATIPVGVDLSAEAGLLGGGTVRGLRAAFDLTPASVSVRELRATLPGDAALQLTGAASGGRFEGDATLAAPAWPQTQAWLAALLPPALSALPPAPLTAVDLSAHVRAESGGGVLNRIAGTLDGARVTGQLGWRQESGASAPRLAAALRLDTVRLDPWLAGSLAGTDLDLRIEAARATWRTLALASFHLDLARTAGAWTLDLQASSGPRSLTASGRVSAAGRLDGGRFSFDAQRLADLQDLPGAPVLNLPAESPLLRAPLHVAAQGSGSLDALSASIQATLGDLALNATPRLDLTAGSWNGPVRLRHPSARLLLMASGWLPWMGLSDATWLGEGGLSLTARCAGTADTLAIDNLTLTAGALRTGGALHLDWKTTPDLSGEIDAETLPLPPWAGLTADWLAGAAPSGQVALAVRAQRVLADGSPVFAPLAADVALAAGKLRLDLRRAGLGGGTLQGSATLDLVAEPPRLSVQASVQDAAIAGRLTGLPVDIVAGQATGQGSLTADGHSPAAMLASMQGEVSGQVLAGSLRGVALAGIPADLPPLAVAVALSGGVTAFDRADFAMRLDHGLAIIADGHVALASGTVTVSGSESLAQAAPDLLLTYRPAVLASPLDPGLAPPVIGLRLLGARGRVQRIAELAPLARWRAARDRP